MAIGNTGFAGYVWVPAGRCLPRISFRGTPPSSPPRSAFLGWTPSQSGETAALRAILVSVALILDLPQRVAGAGHFLHLDREQADLIVKHERDIQPSGVATLPRRQVQPQACKLGIEDTGVVPLVLCDVILGVPLIRHSIAKGREKRLLALQTLRHQIANQEYIEGPQGGHPEKSPEKSPRCNPGPIPACPSGGCWQYQVALFDRWLVAAPPDRVTITATCEASGTHQVLWSASLSMPYAERSHPMPMV